MRMRTSAHERHQLCRDCDEGAHHIAVLVLENMPVVHVPTTVGREPDGDFDDLARIDADRILKAAFVVIDSAVQTRTREE